MIFSLKLSISDKYRLKSQKGSLHHLIQLYNLLVARVSEVNSAELLISMKNNHIQTLSHDFEFDKQTNKQTNKKNPHHATNYRYSSPCVSRTTMAEKRYTKNCCWRTSWTFIPTKTFSLLTFFKIKKDQEGESLIFCAIMILFYQVTEPIRIIINQLF